VLGKTMEVIDALSRSVEVKARLVLDCRAQEDGVTAKTEDVV